MKNVRICLSKIIATAVFTIITLFYCHEAIGQATIESNNPTVGAYLGWDDAQNLEFRTNNSTYMQLMQNGNSTINGFTIDRSGFLGLSQDPSFFTSWAATPYSLLHLNGDNNAGLAQQVGYRDWMRYGITSTHNQDLMFVGQRRMSTDVTDAVIG